MIFASDYMNNQPIGVLDSGVGGLSIWREIVKLLPHESTVYIADSKNCPYGTKTPEEIYLLARRLVLFLTQKEAKLIVLACNTITVNCLDKLRRDFPQISIVGTVPVIKTAVELTANKKIGVLSTIVTANSQYQKELIQKFAAGCHVLNLGTDKLVPFVERGELQGEALQKTVEEVLLPFQEAGVDTIALGCSHYPFLEPVMQQIVGQKVHILDSGAAIARQVKRVLELKHETNTITASHTLYTTGDKTQFASFIAATLPQLQVRIEAISL